MFLQEKRKMGNDLSVTMKPCTHDFLCRLEEREPPPIVPSFSCRVKKMEWFAARFNQPLPKFWCIKIPMGPILYKGEMQPIEVSVACPSDVDLETTEVWVQIGNKYPRIPMLDQNDDPIRLNDMEAVLFIEKVRNRVKLGNSNFFELEKEELESLESESQELESQELESRVVIWESNSMNLNHQSE